MIEVLQPLSLKFKKQIYTANTPTVGDLWDVEVAKTVLSNGRYGAVMSNKTVWSENALDNIDMFAYLSVFLPKLIEDLKIDSWKELGVFDLEEIRKVYVAEFLPWFNKFDSMLKKAREGKNEDVKETANETNSITE